jgi:ATP:ADP antiporter, AAA family
VEFNFLNAIEHGVSSDLEFQTFFGVYKAIQMLGLLLFQWLITSRLLGKIPLKSAFLVLPIFLTLASGTAIGFATLIGSAVARFLARTVYTGWDEPARKSLQALVPDERRGRISTFMDSYFINFATLIGCILLLVLIGCTALGLWSESISRYIYLGIALLAGIGSLFSGLYLRKVYDRSLLNWRLSRSKRKSVLDGIEF